MASYWVWKSLNRWDAFFSIRERSNIISHLKGGGCWPSVRKCENEGGGYQGNVISHFLPLILTFFFLLNFFLYRMCLSISRRGGGYLCYFKDLFVGLFGIFSGEWLSCTVSKLLLCV